MNANLTPTNSQAILKSQTKFQSRNKVIRLTLRCTLVIPVVGCKVAVQPDFSWSFQCLGVTTILTMFDILGNLKSHGKHDITFTDNQWAHS